MSEVFICRSGMGSSDPNYGRKKELKIQNIYSNMDWVAPDAIDESFDVRIFGGGQSGGEMVGGAGGWMNNMVITLTKGTTVRITVGKGGISTNYTSAGKLRWKSVSGGTTSFGGYISAPGGSDSSGGSAGGNMYNDVAKQFGGSGSSERSGTDGGVWGGGGGGGGNGGTYGGGGGGSKDSKYSGSGGTYGGAGGVICSGGSPYMYCNKGYSGPYSGINTIGWKNVLSTDDGTVLTGNAHSYGSGNQYANPGFGGNAGSTPSSSNSERWILGAGGGGYGSNGGDGAVESFSSGAGGGGGGFGGDGGSISYMYVGGSSYSYSYASGGGGGYGKGAYGGVKVGGGGGYYSAGGNKYGGGASYGRGGDGWVYWSDGLPGGSRAYMDGVNGGGGGGINLKWVGEQPGNGGNGICIIKYWRWKES